MHPQPNTLCLPHHFPAAKNKASSYPELESHRAELCSAASFCPYKSIIIMQSEKYYCKYLSEYSEASKKNLFSLSVPSVPTHC